MPGTSDNTRKCPHCGAALHPEASFCPACTQSLNRRVLVKPPMTISRKLLWAVLAVAAAAVLILAVWLYTRPRVYDNGTAEALYSDRGETYQICIAWANTPFTPAARRYTDGQVDFEYRYPSILFINHAESDTNAAETFLQRVESITAEFVQVEGDVRISCTPPRRQTDYIPDAAAITYVDYYFNSPGHCSAELIFTVHMKNGDVIRVHQEQQFDTVNTYNYTPEDAPMGTTAELQALADEIARTVEEDAVVNIFLPPVTYEGRLTLEERAINLNGSTDEQGNRTTFTGPITLMAKNNIFYFDGIDFLGPGDGLGLSASARLHLTGCRVAGWKTGVLCYGRSWVNADGCTFEDNDVAFHFNSIGSNVSDTQYDNNLFQNNGTAFLLESVPTGISLKFDGTRFVGNGMDFDNRCEQLLELEQAFFE